ncbi:hypothetical protein [Arhodomonas sp. AD133]|uniref:hypothetical protein n=1 Tax=Arhodomonas sp. AD133 TaxID=3415009 RepID=UPI003EBD5B04
MSASWPELGRTYLRERYPVALFLPLAVTVAACGITLTPSAGPTVMVLMAAAAWLLLLTLRLLDDLADREVDRETAPDRITVRVWDSRPWLAMAALSLGGAGVLLTAVHGIAGALPAVATMLALALWYAARRWVPGHRRFNALVVMAKYPLVAMAVAGTVPTAPAPLAVFATLYGCALTFEFTHDPFTAPTRSYAWPLACAAITLTAMAFATKPTVWLLGAVVACALGFAASLTTWPAALPKRLAALAWVPALVVVTARIL